MRRFLSYRRRCFRSIFFVFFVKKNEERAFQGGVPNTRVMICRYNDCHNDHGVVMSGSCISYRTCVWPLYCGPLLLLFSTVSLQGKRHGVFAGGVSQTGCRSACCGARACFHDPIHHASGNRIGCWQNCPCGRSLPADVQSRPESVAVQAAKHVNNAAVSDDGGEIGRAQWLQAMACRIPSSVLMTRCS